MTHDDHAQMFFARGWCAFPHDPALAAWVKTGLPHARAAIRDPANEKWFRYQRTWFAGVNVLDNDEAGIVGEDAPALAGHAVTFVRTVLGQASVAWDKAQVSVCYPGYPQPMEGETDGAHRYRRDRDAAHLDGLHPVGPQRRRHLLEAHGFVLGIPMTQADVGASPMVIWEGSHEIIREAFQGHLAEVPSEQWPEIDVTALYQATRKRIFDTCRRVVVHAVPGECYIVHRLAVHGVAPWAEDATAGEDGRMIAYFRPEIAGGVTAWLGDR